MPYDYDVNGKRQFGRLVCDCNKLECVKCARRRKVKETDLKRNLRQLKNKLDATKLIDRDWYRLYRRRVRRREKKEKLATLKLEDKLKKFGLKLKERQE